MKYTDEFKQDAGDKPRGIPLTDSDGTALTSDSDSPAFYKQTASGADTLSFYLDHDGTRYYSLIDVNVSASTSVTLDVALKWYVQGSWKTKFAYTMSLTGTQALGGVSTAYPLMEDVPPGTKVRIDVTTGGAADVIVNAMGRYKA